jgi:hypothetical protein
MQLALVFSIAAFITVVSLDALQQRRNNFKHPGTGQNDQH